MVNQKVEIKKAGVTDNGEVKLNIKLFKDLQKVIQFFAMPPTAKDRNGDPMVRVEPSEVAKGINRYKYMEALDDVITNSGKLLFITDLVDKGKATITIKSSADIGSIVEQLGKDIKTLFKKYNELNTDVDFSISVKKALR